VRRDADGSLIVPHHNWTKAALLSNTRPVAQGWGHLVPLDDCSHGLLCWTLISSVQFFAVGSTRPSTGSRPSPPTSCPSNRRILIGKSAEQRCMISAVYRFMGSFDDAVVRSICGSNDENLCAWWVADVVATGHMNNSNGSGSGLAARDPSFWCRASSLTAMVGIVHGRSIVAAV